MPPRRHPTPAQRAGPGLAENQREHVRHLCADGLTMCLAVRLSYGGHRVLVRDISAGGLGLLMARPLEVGTVIAVELSGGPGEEGCSRLARVAHARLHATPADAPWLPRPHAVMAFLRWFFGAPGPRQEPSWFVGCRFDVPLTEEEVRRLL
jgi:hypothetical protein